METELQSLGIPPVQVQAREEDKIEVKKAYMGLAIKYGEDTEVIPVVKQTSGLEYDLTSLIIKLTREKTPKIVIATGPDSLTPQQEMGKVYNLLAQIYDVSTVDLSTTSEIGADVDALVVVGGKTPFSDEAQRAIDSFVVSGRSVAFLVDAVKPDLATLQSEEADHGLTEMLKSYGVTVAKSLVLDTQCATINVQRQQGFLRFSQPVPYPFMPIAKSTDVSNPLTLGMSEISFPFMSEVEVSLPEQSEVTAEVVAKSSSKAWAAAPPYNLDPFQEFTVESAGEQKERGLLVSLSGPLKSHFGTASDEDVDGADSRILVAGGSAFVTDQFAQQSNLALVLNIVDWLVLDEALATMRARGLAGAPLDPELGDAARNVIKYGNILGLPMLFVVFGLVRWRRREARRAVAAF